MKLSLLVFAALVATASTSVRGALDAKAKAKGKYFGNILDQNTIDVPQVTDILDAEFGVITPERSMTWNVIEPTQGQFVWTDADAVVDWAASHGKLVRGHTLVWHAQLPEWVNAITDRGVLARVIQDHINQVAGRYRGRMYHWDVVNGVLQDTGEFRDSVFYRVLGEGFVDLAFRTARAADPGAKLYLSEYNLDKEGPKLDNTIALVKRLQARGTPIDGLGAHVHLVVAGNDTEADCRLAGITQTLGLELAVTALDIRVPRGPAVHATPAQRRAYAGVTRACVEAPRCVGVTVWGVSERDYGYEQGKGELGDGRDDYGGLGGVGAPLLLWDAEYKRRGAYSAVEDALN